MSKHKGANPLGGDEKSTNKKSNNKSDFPKSMNKKEAIQSTSKEVDKVPQEAEVDHNGETVCEKAKGEATSVEKPSKRALLALKSENSQKSRMKEMEKNEKDGAVIRGLCDSAQIKEGHNNVESNVTEFSSIKPNQEGLESANLIKKAATESKKAKNSVSGTKQSRTQMKNEEKCSIMGLSAKQSKKKEILEQKQSNLPAEDSCDVKTINDQPNYNLISNDQEQPSNASEGELYVAPLGNVGSKKSGMTMRSAKRSRPIAPEEDEAEEEYKKKIQKVSIEKSSKKLPQKSQSKAGKSAQKPSKSALKSVKKVKANPADSISEKK